MHSTGIAEFEEWRTIRLPNWGRSKWVGLMEGAPDSSCANPLYDSFIWHDGRDGDGEITADTVVVAQTSAARAELPPIDHEDAEMVGGWVAQLPSGHRSTLARKYVLRERVDRDRVDAAIHAVLTLKHENRRVTVRVRAMMLRWGE